ncbi:MAG: 2-oxoglutarate dehydrogenase complex dihydrolipoyllysine-residue succinyltransferase [Gammaproteobacteria bacterium]|jgi:2-oxoglutarate dehydrogenase E2 component (dihydrolipoamide succinyltransferase)|nr:2-oxoglutarate dehydrogenase complex dihydrolipoyllysine-residue succinyltransferase [Gammaproteobacteria bacterium]MDH3848045.1 2-oxoglutarate dehydrogenase complex dihydrolipoyllysine-residue succinyltransferase [Gammaproteobacteria bacterium]MDH3864129.1 2-oxoglutarate dehydrogenase complex dihydrolipoyllysine-residue succinyltransferase [Gammaproteobacteria bacterium]MDH3904325.1 2-oxoglutarate dehydrogenase complex dihydrolipoyllysine-residue succinyltransferase [Gammaproteobacteria bact
MSIEIKVPALPESVTDATLVAWHKKAGERVNRDENLVDLETDKVVLEVPAPADGVLQEIKVDDGATVTAGDVLAVLAEGEGAGQAAAEPAQAEEQPAAVEEPPAESPRAAKAGKTSPAVRRLLEEHDLEATIVTGTGKDGRITKADVMAFLKADESSDVTPGDRAPVADDAHAAVGLERSEQRVPMTRLRARIAERMVDAQHTAAMLTTFNEVDLTEVMALRSRYKDSFEKKHGVRLGFMSFFAKAAVEGLKKFPAVNASVEDNDIVYHNYYDIGIAVSTQRGLMVPVLRDVDQMSFARFETELGAMATKAQEGAIGMDDLTGGTFTITNGGIFGSMMSTPILNPPQSAILGMHNIQQRPMVVDGEIKIRPMMYLAVTYDHRIIDGREAVQFLVTIKEQLEDPGRLLLQV